ncbi:tRNA1(Val) (adenine(37)-N6)-methyltransferase [Acetomicrobium hydrogeniformans]|nr:methyltransferase domain-containing protein [Acetomicrobium hydrogeniformans]
MEITLDDILYGKLKLKQPLHGPRVSVDTVLLSWFVRLRSKDRVMELGTASGAVALILAKRWQKVSAIKGIDIQEELIEIARENALANDLEDKVTFERGDVREISAICPPQTFDAVVVNPPYDEAFKSRTSPKEGVALAKQGIACTLEDVIRASFYLLKDRGRLYMVLRAKRTSELCYLLEKNRMPLKRLKIVYPKPKTEASVVLIEARRNAGRGLRLEPPLFICDERGDYTPELLAAYELEEN